VRGRADALWKISAICWGEGLVVVMIIVMGAGVGVIVAVRRTLASHP